MMAVIPVADMIEQDDPLTENQQIAVDYARDFVLPMLAEGGVWMAPAETSPLTMQETMYVLKVISELEVYKGQRIDLVDNMGCRIRLIENGMMIQAELVPGEPERE